MIPQLKLAYWASAMRALAWRFSTPPGDNLYTISVIAKSIRETATIRGYHRTTVVINDSWDWE